MTVHPRVRGDDETLPDTVSLVRGSPPRAWGRSKNEVVRDALLRFTPACVGTIALPNLIHPGAPVHPRVRGDDPSRVFGAGWDYGSPPRAWGRSGVEAEQIRERRFTPACVGTMWPE